MRNGIWRWTRRVAVFLHIIVLITSVTYIHLYQENDWLGKTIYAYKELSKSGWSYGFFGGESGYQNDLKAYMLHNDTLVAKLSSFNEFDFGLINQENQVRMYGFKSRMLNDSLTFVLTSKYVARLLFAKYPGCNRILLANESLKSPSREDFLLGKETEIRNTVYSEFGR